MYTPRRTQPTFPPKSKKLTPLEAFTDDLPKGYLKAGLDWFSKTDDLGKVLGVGVAIFLASKWLNRNK